jgi:serine/threonine protein kinase
MHFSEFSIKKIEGLDTKQVIDTLILEFPPELQDRLWDEVQELDDYAAQDYLTSKLIQRKLALLPPEYMEVPKHMEIINDNPEAVKASIELANKQGSDFVLGRGLNGIVIPSTQQDGICYKTLFLERANQLASSIAREALLQNSAQQLLEKFGKGQAVPNVSGFVNTKEIKAIKMKKVNGFSLKEHISHADKYPLPENFDIDLFFDQLEEIITILNQAGYFHRDLYANAGNVLCDENANPVLIDFGSAVKAVDYNADDTTYQIVPNGQRYYKNDLAGVRDLRHRVQSHILKNSKVNSEVGL